MQTTEEFLIRDARSADLARLLEINQANTPHVGPLSDSQLQILVEQSCGCRVAERDGTVTGFLLPLLAGANYNSENFLWFKARYREFLYIDRIAVDAAARRQGLGSQLYADVERFAHNQGIGLIACEVNLRPRNDTSLQFHRRLGFQQVGTQDTKNGTITVALLTKELSDENLG